MQRDKVSDLLKGYACILVVLGHVLMGIQKAGMIMPTALSWIEQIIGTFDFQIFLFLSGFTYHIMGEWKYRGTRADFLWNKVLNIGIPYVIFSIVYILINSCVGRTNTSYLGSDILSIWKTPVAQYWFLYSLLLLFILWTVLSRWLKNVQITLLLGIAAIVVEFAKIPMYEGIQKTFPCVILFGLGTCITRDTMNRFYEKAKTPYGLIAVALYIAVLAMYPLAGDYLFVYTQILSLLGIGANIVLIVNLQRFLMMEKVFMAFKNYSFAIYLLHTIFTAATRIILMRVGIYSLWIHILCGCAMGYGIPVCVVIFCRKLGIYDYIFIPAKVWIRKK